MNASRTLAGLAPAARFIAVVCLAAVSGQAAPLTETTAIQTRPELSAPAIGVIKAGAEPSAAEVVAPTGWLAVNVPGPFEGYVQNADLSKSLDVKPGSGIYLAPSADSGVLATAAKGDKISITGLRGKWTQVRLDRTVVGFIHLGPITPAGQTAETPQTVAQAVPEAAAAASSSAPVTDAGKPAAGPAADAPGSAFRYLEGKFVSTRHLLSPRRPYDWQIEDAAGTRIAYLDLSKLLLTEQADSYAGHTVEVFGAVNPVPGTRDIVINVENLQLR